jgi:hypothetical protein
MSPLLPLENGLLLLGHEFLEGFLERQGAGLPGDVSAFVALCWRPTLPDTTWQARAVGPLGINVDDITCQGIVVASALLVVELLPKGKAIFLFFRVLEDVPTMAQCEGLVLSYAVLKCSKDLRIYTLQ